MLDDHQQNKKLTSKQWVKRLIVSSEIKSSPVTYGGFKPYQSAAGNTLDGLIRTKSLPVSRGIKSLIISSEIKSLSATYGIKTLPVSCR